MKAAGRRKYVFRWKTIGSGVRATFTFTVERFGGHSITREYLAEFLRFRVQHVADPGEAAMRSYIECSVIELCKLEGKDGPEPRHACLLFGGFAGALVASIRSGRCEGRIEVIL